MTEICECSKDCAVPFGSCHCGCGGATRIAPQTSTDRGWVKGKPIRFLKGHAPRGDKHVLTNIDMISKEADCSRCGRVNFRKNGANGIGCSRQLTTNHKVSEIDIDAMAGYCRQCRSVVSVYKRSDTGIYCCFPAHQLRAKRYAEEHREERAVYAAEYTRTHKREARERLMKKKYGITDADFQIMVTEQDGLCFICHRPPHGKGAVNAVLHLDHCHTSTKVGRPLCGDCNRGLGSFGDDAQRLRAAADYLDAHR